ncbi:MAG: ATP-binding protein [Candidatus Paceibacterota bacterium]|jgi:hypothetical protein
MKKFSEIFETINFNNILKQSIYFFLFLSLLVILCIINYIITGQIIPTNETKNLWFYSGIVMIIFTIFFVEPYYTAPTNVFVNSFALVLMMISIPQKEFGDSYWWWAGLIFFIFLLIFSFISKAIHNTNKSDDFILNRLSFLIRDFLVIIGSGKILFSLVFFYFLLSSYLEKVITNKYILILFVFWSLVILISPEKVKSIIENYILKKDLSKTKSLGNIFAVQSDGMFLVRLHDNKTTYKFTTVIFRNLIDRDDDNLFSIGFIFDIYFLKNEKWAKVLFIRKATKEENITINTKKYKKDFIYKSDENYISKEINCFVGVIIENSDVGKIKFEYSEKIQKLEEGHLLELRTRNIKLFYQVIGCSTEKEKLESWNETGFIIGEAIQLGQWKENLSFEKFGWVPPINTPVFLADTENEKVPSFSYPDYKLGVIPGTKLPSVINLNDAVSHHMAILGVTGSGKSFIAHEILKELQKDTKVVCIDFTGEYKEKFDKDKTKFEFIINDPGKIPEVEQKIAELETEKDKGKFADKTKILEYKKAIQKKLDEYVKIFIETEGKSNIGLFELPELSNTTFLLEFTQFFIEAVFNYAKCKNNKDCKIVLVLEEAHTIVPETNFLGDLGDYGSNKALVSKMSQVALQGRKYKVGLLVIGQRSANISKTVLTQCNTVISFKAFDDTSFGFLTNYIGKEMVSLLPNLKQYQAIVTGKAIKSDTPMVIDLTR